MTDIETNSSGEAFDALKAYYTDKVKPCFEASDDFYTRLAAYLDSLLVRFQEVDMELAKSISD